MKFNVAKPLFKKYGWKCNQFRYSFSKDFTGSLSLWLGEDDGFAVYLNQGGPHAKNFYDGITSLTKLEEILKQEVNEYVVLVVESNTGIVLTITPETENNVWNETNEQFFGLRVKY